MYTKEIIVNKIQEFYNTYNKIPTSRDFQKFPGYPGTTTVQRYFGSWNAAIKAAQLEENIPTYSKILDKAKIIELIQKYYKEYNNIPSTRDFDNNPEYPHSTTINIYFGSWNSAIEASGFSVYNKKEIIYTDQQLLDSIISFYELYNRVPNNRDFINNANFPSYTTIVKRFNSWNEAITKAGLLANAGCYGIPTKGLDNHIYRSAAEAYFCDRYLYKKHKYHVEPKYPSPYSMKRYDWYIPIENLYIELDGGLRPLVTKQKQQINKNFNRVCLLIPESTIYNKKELKDFIHL